MRRAPPTGLARIVLLWFCPGALAWSVLSAKGGDARACSGTAVSDVLLLVTSEVPANGQVVLRFWCRDASPWAPAPPCSAPVTLAILDELNEPVPGELTRFGYTEGAGAVYYFKPAAALPVGAVYSVGVDAQHLPYRFRVIPALTADPTPLSADASLAPATRTLRGVCCEEVLSSCGAPYLCVPLEVEQGARLGFDVRFPQSQYGQWRTRVHSWRADGTELVGAWDEGYTTTFEQRAEYCIRAEISSLLDGTTYLLDERCFAQGDLPQFGAHGVDVSPHALGISQCAYPRPGTEQAWCEGMAQRCGAGGDADALDVVSAPEPVTESGCTLAPATGGRMLARGWLCLLLASWLARRRHGLCRGPLAVHR